MIDETNPFGDDVAATPDDAAAVHCPNCAAALTYRPSDGMFVCEYCNGKFTHQQLRAMRPDAADDEAAGQADQPTETLDDLQEYSCPNCGASILTDETTAAQFCAYCGNPVILKGRVSGQLKPNKIIPFTVDKQRAITILQEYLAKKRFVPKSFRSLATLEKITGIYHPFWLTDADCDCAMQAKGTRVTVWVSGDKRYTRTDYYDVWRRGDVHFEDIASNALQSADKELVEGVLPFPVDAYHNFDMAYLSGFYAKRNDLSREDVRDEVSRKMRQYSEQLLRQTAPNFDTLDVLRNAVLVNQSHWDYTLLPIWLLNYQYRNKTYTFAVNGYTGKLFGQLPISRPKLAILGSAVGVAVAALLGLIGGLLL